LHGEPNSASLVAELVNCRITLTEQTFIFIFTNDNGKSVPF